jgi:hypothetical protein
MMDITRNVILDLLPLYLADEVSEDTRALIDKYLETDPGLAEIAKNKAAMELTEEIPVPLTKEDKMKTYERARWMKFLYIVLFSLLLSFTGLVVLVVLMLFAR